MDLKNKIGVLVALTLPLQQVLTYSLQSDTTNGVLGRRVLVPLSGRQVTGYIVGFQDIQDASFTVRSVIRLLDVKPLFHETLLPFFEWVARYYHYPLGLVIKTALPSGLTQKSVRVLVVSENNEHSLLEKTSEFCDTPPEWVIQLAAELKLNVSESRSVFENKEEKKLLDSLLATGVVVIGKQLMGDKVQEKKEVCYRLIPEALNIDYLHATSQPEPFQIEEFRQSLVDFLEGKVRLSEAKVLYYFKYQTQITAHQDVPKRDILKHYAGANKALQWLDDRGVLEVFERRVFRNPFGDELPNFPRVEHLTPEQDIVLDEIRAAIHGRKFAPFLLHGVTGSGKTEVYLRAAEETLALGRDVLVLVPEIALATQLEAHFVSRFGDLVVLQHSGLKDTERYDQWSLALSGLAKVVIGARSAVFAPLKDPGLIIVDEEHDPGFKQDDSFRYHGRDIAVLRGRQHDAVVVLGSATPSITSYFHAKSDKYKLLRMSNRVGERSLPTVQVVDLGLKINGQKGKGIFRKELKEAMQQTYESGKQTVLLMNRRGFSAVVICKDCGEIVNCKHCNVSLTLHKKSQKLICHYCGYAVSESVLCGSCGSSNIVPVGFGTERVEEEVRNLFPEANVARLDSDTAGNREKFLQILSDMRQGNIDILIGTQMIAKGHHFPNVVLVGVVWADGGMSLPDFRAAEKTFQLISQVTGRAGRGEFPGHVIIQTMRPDHYAIVLARRHDFQAFYDHEMNIRKNPAFPPFVRMIAFHIQGEREDDVRQSAGNIAMLCRKESREKKISMEILGPAPAPIDKIKNRYRWQVLIKSTRYEELHGLCAHIELNATSLLVRKSKMSIDVDPDNLM